MFLSYEEFVAQDVTQLHSICLAFNPTLQKESNNNLKQK